MPDTKHFHAPLELKDLTEGSFKATFARLNVIDLDGDVTVPGAFTSGSPVKIAAWSHNWDALPVGKGVIYADDQSAWVEGLFNLNTASGRDHYEAVKFNGNDQEWSYGFEVKASSPGEFEGRQVRFLRSLDVFETSPVMRGAGIDTRTEYVKSADSIGRLLSELRAELKEGRVLSEARRQQLAMMADTVHGHIQQLSDHEMQLRQMHAETAPKPKSDGRRLWREYLALEARLNGVPA